MARMPAGHEPGGSVAYEIRIKGRVSAQLLSVFEGMEASEQSVETVLRGPVVDQAALHGLLDRIQSLGLELIEVRRVSADAPKG
ncbi:MAG TPA: hypothetical protein VK756_02655 [Solirubrobacteraceae bacterium]|jgi:hypothetical protein|nr:hypothetical protein [Solirubrobacteraceae bacterium]